MATIHTMVCDPLGIANIVPKESRDRLIEIVFAPFSKSSHKRVFNAKHDMDYYNIFRAKNSPSKWRPSNSGTQYHIVKPYNIIEHIKQ